MAIACSQPSSERAAGPAALADIVQRCAAGEIPANIALMQLIAEAQSPGEIEALLGTSAVSPGSEVAQRELAALWHGTPAAWELVRTVLGQIDHSRTRTPAGVAQLFDRLGATTPDAATALYALGRADLMTAATTGIIEALDGFGLLGRDRDVLDLGCGAGRVSLALAPRVRTVVGIDISPAMIGRARARLNEASNVTFAVANGTDLGALGDASIDLVVAADVFPYIVMCGESAVTRQMSEIARVLRSGGTLIVFNWSYGTPLDDECRDVARQARAAGLRLIRSGSRDVVWWDGRTFQMQRMPGTT